MLAWRRFDYKSLAEIEKDIQELGVNLPLSENLDILGQPIEIYGHKIKNRLAIQPLEGFDASLDGTPGDLTFRRYRRFSAGGAGLIWFESCSSSSNSQTSRWQCHMSRENLPVFKRLLMEIRDYASDGIVPYLIVQLTHSGNNARLDGDGAFDVEKDGVPQYVVARNPYITKPNARIISDDDLKRIQDDYIESAKLAKEVGFDAIDIRACHGYLMAEILGSFTRENSIYGGASFENRTRFLLETIERVIEEVKIDIGIRLNVCDMLPYPYGWGMAKDGSLTPDLTEPLRLAGMLIERGVKLINVSMGRSHVMHYLMPSSHAAFYPQEHPLTSVALYNNFAAEVKKAYPEAIIMTGTLSWARQFSPHVAAGGIETGMYDIAGFGRMPFAYPDFANDILKKGGLDTSKVCLCCNSCMDMMSMSASTGCPLGCPIRDREIYAPLFKEYVGSNVRPIQPAVVELFGLTKNPPAKE